MEASLDAKSILHRQYNRRLMVFWCLGFLTLLLIVLNLVIGSVSYPPVQVLKALRSPFGQGDLAFTVWSLRLPRTLATIMGGAFLAASGLLLQVYFRNPIVGPFILGISSGATLTVSLVMLTGIGFYYATLSPYLITMAGCIGAYATVILVLAIATKVRGRATLLVVGLMMGYVCSAITSILTALAETERIKGFVLWGMGSFSRFSWLQLGIMFFVGGSLTVLVFILAKPLNAFLLGEDYAASVGVDIRRFRLFILLASSSLAGLVTSMAGPVAFIGLAVPHMARLSLGTSDNRVLIPGACLLGASVTSLCDLIARMWLSPVELPISAITAIFGAPIVIGLLLKRGFKS
ncbi:MAG: iron ABC transporter permease [Deltaproteobacteria bacterium]|jgi:iron complex transport system permease protein|nr:iron ABC transporter permease [Deltaproteobacteria bacterium]